MASASYTGIGIHLRLDSVLTSRPWGLQPLYPGHRIDSSSVTLRTPQVDTLPSFTRILNILLRNTQPKNNDDRKTFITNIAILHEVAFSPKCPILGTGHHFAVFASPFDADDRGFVPLDGRAVNPEVYCLKSPNFTSGGGTDSPPSKVAFRTEYYNTTLRELRVLLCPQLRRCENIISLFGLDFQEDYDDYTVAWPVLLMEYAEYGTLDTLQQDVTIDLDLARILLLDVAKGIQALHQCNIIHGDIKSENVLICRHNQRKYIARLGDFGLSLINPDPEKNDHRLPGGTFFWSAPEVGSALSVQGLRQTDIYSFGLAAWRVFINHPNPFELISPAALGTPISRSLTKAVTRAKSQNGFDQLVLQTMKRCGSHIYSHQVIEATLTKDPTGRSLDAVISALSRGREVALPNSEASEMYWATEEPALVLEQLDELCDERLPQLAMKPSVLHSLAREFESIFSSNSALAMQTGWFLFKFASSPSFQLLNKNIDECCRVLVRLCHLGFPLARAIVFRYHQLYSKDFQLLDREWLEEAAMDGSYYALKSLRMHYPEEHQKLMRSRLSIEPALDDFEKEDSLLKLCRQGDYDGCREMLRAGASAFPIEEGMVSPLHWLVSFNDENQISDLLNLLLQNGAVIDAYEGQIQDATFGRVKGTPLHWAVWYRNIPVLRALIRVSDQPTLEHLNRAIFIAAGMHFYDVLEILRDWIRSLKDGTHARCDWSIALICAAYNGIWQLPRSLRHGTKKLSMAFEKTMDIVVASRKPPEKDIRTLFQLSRAENNGLLLRYLFSRLNLAKRIDILNDPYCDIATASVGMGFRDIFELGIQNGIIGPQTEHGSQRFKALQICCSSRQRDPYFAGRLLDIGCAVDGRSTYTDGTWTPFAIAVALGLYHIAILLLERGADKDYLLGWLGGSTVTMNLLQSWPDIPVSRLKFLLEEVPRLGFGHVAFWSWPGAGGNLLYALSLSHWSSYAAGFRLGETAKYILSQLADKSCLNRIDKIGATALRMACASGNLEICQALIEAGQDVNLALGFSPLGNAKDWLKKCRKREKAAMANNNCLGGERRLAQALRIRAEQTVKLMEKHRAMDRGFFESIQNTTEYVSSGQWQMPSYETALELFSGLLDRSPLVEAGSTPLQPTSSNQFKIHHGKKSNIQERLANFGLRMDQANPMPMQRPAARYQPHNCLPWRHDSCVTRSNAGSGHLGLVTVSHAPVIDLHSPRSGPISLQVTDCGNISSFAQPHASNPNLFEDICSSSFTNSHGSIDSASPTTPPLIGVQIVERRIQDFLLLYFLDGGDVATEGQRRDQVAIILKENGYGGGNGTLARKRAAKTSLSGLSNELLVEIVKWVGLMFTKQTLFNLALYFRRFNAVATPIINPEHMYGYAIEDFERAHLAIKRVCRTELETKVWMDYLRSGNWHALAALTLFYFSNLRGLDFDDYEIPDPFDWDLECGHPHSVPTAFSLMADG